MKTLVLLILLISCGSEIQFADKNKSIQDATPAAEVSISASRDYFPNRWKNGVSQITTSGYYVIEQGIEVLAGNAGTGWLSILIGEAKLCYQGTASSNSNISTLFKLKYEIAAESHCNKAVSPQVPRPLYFLNKDEMIMLNIEGGGCNKATCTYTEAQTTLVRAVN